MSNETTFVDKVTVISAGWANDVDHLVYALLGPGGNNPPASVADVRTALGLGPLALTTANAAQLPYTPGAGTGIPGVDATVQAALDYLGVTQVAIAAIAQAAMPEAGGNFTGPTTFESLAVDGSDVNLRFASAHAGLTSLNLTMRLNPTTGAFEYQNTAGAVTSSLSDAGILAALQLQAAGVITNNAAAGVYGHRYMQRAGTTFVDEYLDTSGNFGLNVGGASPVNAYSINQAGLLTFGVRPKVGANLVWDAGNFNPALYSTLAGAPTFGGTVTAPYLVSTGKAYAVNGANLLTNSTGELGFLGWAGGWLPYNDINGSYFGYPGTGTGQTSSYIGPRATVAPSSPIVVSLEAASSSVTAGTMSLLLTYLNAAGATISTATLPITNGQAWEWYWQAFTTPALCTSVMVSLVLTGATVSTGSVPAIRRIKVEYGTQPSTYSQEATISGAQLANVTTLGQASSSARLQADFSNSSYGQRALLQSMTAGGTTYVGAIPNTTGLGSQFIAHGRADPSNSPRLSVGFGTDGATALVNLDSTGSGTTPSSLQWQSAGVTQARLMSGTGALMVGPIGFADDTVNLLQVAGGIRSSAGGFTFPDGTTQVTANGVTAPTSVTYSVANGNVALGATSIVTSGYTAPFVEIFRSGGRTTNGTDWTYAGDSKTINLAYPVTNTDAYEVLTKVVYSPSTIFTPTTAYFTPAAGSSFIPITYTPGFARVWKNGVKLVIGQDVDNTSGTQLTFLLVNANGVDQYEVEIWTPMTVANMLPLSGGIVSGTLSVTQMLTASSGITFGDTSVQTVAGYTPNRNLLDNAAFMVDQTGSGSSSTTSGAYWFGADRWSMTNSSSGIALTIAGALSGSAVLGYNGVTYPALSHTVVTVAGNYGGSSYYSGIAQTIESYRLYGKQGSPMMMSFVFYSSVNGTFTFALRTGQGTVYSFLYSFTAVAGISQRVVIPIPALPVGASFPYSFGSGLYMTIGAVNGGTYLGSVVGSWSTGNYMVATGSTQWTQTVGNRIIIAQPQLEFGTVATPFENRDVATEFKQAQRFFNTTVGTRFTYIGVAGGEDRTSYSFPTSMRAVPTLSISSAGVSTNATLQTPIAYDLRGFAFRLTATAAGVASIDSSVIAADARI